MPSSTGPGAAQLCRPHAPCPAVPDSRGRISKLPLAKVRSLCPSPGVPFTMISATQSNHPLAGVASSPAASPVDAACARLRENGLRITQPRVALLTLLTRQNGPVSIEQLHAALKDRSCDLVTVYRCLSAFEGIGLVRRSFLHNGTSLYELTLGNTPHHYHSVCKSCGQTERVDYFPIQGVETVLRERGYTQVTHLVEFFGICPKCQTVLPRREVTPTAER